MRIQEEHNGHHPSLSERKKKQNNNKKEKNQRGIKRFKLLDEMQYGLHSAT